MLTAIGQEASGVINSPPPPPPLNVILILTRLHSSAFNFEFHLFADYSTLFYSDNSLVDLENKINIELSSIYDWLSANKLSLNT